MNPLDLRFPLDDEYLPRLLVDRSTVTAWTRAAKAEITNVVQNKTSWYYRSDELSRSFKLIYEKESLRGFARSSESADKKDFLCQSNVRLSLDDIAYGLYSESTFEQRSINVQLYQETFLDAAVLHVSERQTVDDPFHFAGVKWGAFSAPSSGLGAPRDIIYFEYSCKTTDADGHPVLVQYLECPELQRHQLQEHDMGLTRGSMLMINTFRADKDGSTYCQSAGTFDVGKSMGSWGSTKALPQSFKGILNLVGLADARAIVNLGVLKTLPARQEGSDKKACYVCAKKFNVLTRQKQNCRSCGRCTCRKCIVGLKFFNENSLYSSTLPVVSEKFCFKCVMNSREQRKYGGSLSMSRSGSSSLSLSQSGSGTFRGAASATSDSTNNSFCIDDQTPEIVHRMENLGLSSLQPEKPSLTSESEGSERDSNASGSFNSRTQSHSKTKSVSISLIDEDAANNLTIAGERRTAKSTQAVSAAPTGPSSAPATGPRSKSVYSVAAAVDPLHAANYGAPGAGGMHAFAKMSEALAAQNALLMNIQNERNKIHGGPSSGRKASGAGGVGYGYAQYVASPPISPVVGSTFASNDDDRFEILD
ncbi:hypothetical protein Gpo141_00005404 [Globisporangium polare]